LSKLFIAHEQVDFNIEWIIGLAIAKGNCNNMNREMQGKILSEVNGASEVKAAVANELNATITSIDELFKL
jgi:hypothetical protein